MQIEWVPTNSLVPNPKNRNKHPKEQIERLSKIIKANGWRHPIIVSKLSGQVVVGHGRLEAAKLLSEPKVPVHFQDFANETEEYQFGIADNAIASWAELDLAGINTDLPTFGPELDVDLLGIKDFELEPADKYGDKDTEETPATRATDIQTGDLFCLGSHRLMCGDSTDALQVERLMNGEKADMVFTDPPYGVDYSGGIQFTDDGVKKESRKKLENDGSADIYLKAIPVISQFVEGPCYTWFADTKALPVYSAIESVGQIHALIIWVKNGGYAAMNAHYKQKHEPCLYWKPEGSTLRWNGESTENTIWEINKDMVNKLHPTQKPVALAERAIRNHSVKSVLDVFCGSGSTLIACEKTNRKCYGMEIDPQYCQVIIDRWENLTGQKAVKLSTNQ